MKLRVKEILSEQGRTAAWLSRKIGVTDVNTRNIANGVVKPKLDTIEKIAAALGVPVWQLFASPEEVKESGAAITCPKCHNVIPVEIEIKPKK